MDIHHNKFVCTSGDYFNVQGQEIHNTNRVIIGIKDIINDIIYPHPITGFLDENYHRYSTSINSEWAAANVIVPFLNFVYLMVIKGEKGFKKVKGLTDLTMEHADRYLEYCVEYKGNKNSTLYAKENYISNFYKYLWKKGILKEEPNFILVQYRKKGRNTTSYKLDFTYKRTDETLLREVIKRKDMVPQTHISNSDRKFIRLNYIREFLLVALEKTPEIAFAIALQFYGGLRVGEVLNLVESALVSQNGGKYGERGLIIKIRDRQNTLFERTNSRKTEEVKNPRDQSLLVDPVLCILYENHFKKILKKIDRTKNSSAIFYNSKGLPMTYASYYKRFGILKSFYLGQLLTIEGRLQDYKDFSDTRWSTHIGRGAFTNMCIDAGFSASETAVLRGDRSIQSMESYKDQISATYNISRALGLLEPQKAQEIATLNIPIYHKYWKEVIESGKILGLHE